MMGAKTFFPTFKEGDPQRDAQRNIFEETSNLTAGKRDALVPHRR